MEGIFIVALKKIAAAITVVLLLPFIELLSQYHCYFTTPLEFAFSFFDGGRWRQQWVMAMVVAASDGGGDGSSVGKC